jgi:beta-lactamase class A
VLDTGSHARADYRGTERFPLCSTFKLLAAGAVLRKVDQGRETLDRRIRFAASDVVTNSPVTKDSAGGEGMSLAELCEAAITRSDNTAGNLLLRTIDGPAGLTTFAQSLGDSVTRLDRIEPDLNEALPGDKRDTTSPAAMLSDIRKLVLGSMLSGASRDQLKAWLVGNKTGDARLRAGIPHGWIVGDKTGTGEHGSNNDVAIVWPPGRGPVIVAVYLTGATAPPDQCNAIIADVARCIFQTGQSSG